MNKRDEIWKEKFIEELRKRGAVQEACAAAGISTSAAYAARKKAMVSSEASRCSPAENGSASLIGFDFAAQWEDAIREAVERETPSVRDANANRATQSAGAMPRKKRRPRQPNGSWKDKFIGELRRRGVVKDAARAAHIDVATAYNERRNAILRRRSMEAQRADFAVDAAKGTIAPAEDFAARWDEAIEEALETLEDEARRRAVDGVPEPVLYRGRKVGEVKRYSDGLLSLMLKAHRPRKYREGAFVEDVSPRTQALLEKYYESIGASSRPGTCPKCGAKLDG